MSTTTQVVSLLSEAANTYRIVTKSLKLLCRHSKNFRQQRISFSVHKLCFYNEACNLLQETSEDPRIVELLNDNSQGSTTASSDSAVESVVREWLGRYYYSYITTLQRKEDILSGLVDDLAEALIQLEWSRKPDGEESFFIVPNLDIQKYDKAFGQLRTCNFLLGELHAAAEESNNYDDLRDCPRKPDIPKGQVAVYIPVACGALTSSLEHKIPLTGTCVMTLTRSLESLDQKAISLNNLLAGRPDEKILGFQTSDQLLLALYLTEAYVCLLGTPWLQSRWSADHAVILGSPSIKEDIWTLAHVLCRCEDGKYIIGPTFGSGSGSGPGPGPGPKSEPGLGPGYGCLGSDTCIYQRTKPPSFNLGVTLLEISFLHSSLSCYKGHDGWSFEEKNVWLMCDRPNPLGGKYKRVVQQCLTGNFDFSKSFSESFSASISPSHSPTEWTLDDLQARLKDCVLPVLLGLVQSARGTTPLAERQSKASCF